MTEAGSGGDCIFHVGAPGVGDPLRGVKEGEPGNFIFRLQDGSDILRISGKGEVFVKGEKVDDNRLVYSCFLSWLDAASISLDKGEADGKDATLIEGTVARTTRPA